MFFNSHQVGGDAILFKVEEDVNSDAQGSQREVISGLILGRCYHHLGGPTVQSLSFLRRVAGSQKDVRRAGLSVATGTHRSKGMLPPYLTST